MSNTENSITEDVSTISIENQQSYSNNNKQCDTKTDALLTDHDNIELQQRPNVLSHDETDAASVYSYYMVRDFRYWFQHPYARLSIAYLVTFLNFFIYAEDPVSHSRQECRIPVIGHVFSFIFTKYPPNLFAGFKVFMWICGIILGMVLGKLLMHRFVFSKFFLNVFK